MAFENARTWFFWFIRKLRNDPSDMLPGFFVIAMLVLVGWMVGLSIYDSLHSERAVCTKFEVTVYIDPDTKEERPSAEEFCTEWISPVTGKTQRKKE